MKRLLLLSMLAAACAHGPRLEVATTETRFAPVSVRAEVAELYTGAAYTGTLYEGGAIVQPVYAKGGLFIGTAMTAATENRLTKSPATGATSIDFAGVTDQCEDSPNVTVTGAQVGDTCNVGTPAAMPCTHCWLTCYVSAADTAKVRLCAHGASGNPAAANYRVRTFSNQ